MNEVEMKARYDHLYDVMSNSKDVDKMKIFGRAGSRIFEKIIVADPNIAKEWIEMLEPVMWNNYLTEDEAEQIVESLEEKVGDMTVRRHEWGYDTLKSAVEGMGGMMAEAPFYNCWALWATMNMLVSDHRNTVDKFIQPAMRVKFYYHLALDKLKDVDRPHFVREYFHLMP